MTCREGARPSASPDPHPAVTEVNCALLQVEGLRVSRGAGSWGRSVILPPPPLLPARRVPFSPSPVSGPLQGALAARQVCLSAEAGISSRHGSESVGRSGEALLPPRQLPELKPLAPSRVCLAFQTTPHPTWPEEARSVALAVPALRWGREGLLFPGPDEGPWD